MHFVNDIMALNVLHYSKLYQHMWELCCLGCLYLFLKQQTKLSLSSKIRWNSVNTLF